MLNSWQYWTLCTNLLFSSHIKMEEWKPQEEPTDYMTGFQCRYCLAYARCHSIYCDCGGWYEDGLWCYTVNCPNSADPIELDNEYLYEYYIAPV